MSDVPVEDEALARFQEALTEQLYLELPAEELLQRLLDDARTAPFRDYVQAMDLRCVEIAAVLMRSWYQRD